MEKRIVYGIYFGHNNYISHTKEKKMYESFSTIPITTLQGSCKKMHGHFMNWRKLTAGALDSFPQCLQNGRRNIWAQNVVMLRLIKQNTTSIVF